MSQTALKIMVLAGGPDQERPVSLQSGASVAQALMEAGHEVRQHDPQPDDLSFLDAIDDWGGDVVFPVLHGPWGEGGPLQRILENRGVAFVGCGSHAADLCMDKYRTKRAIERVDIPTARFELIQRGQAPALAPPVVVKAPREGSSIDLKICRDADALADALRNLHTHHETLMIEQFIDGLELTVGVLGDAQASEGAVALPAINIVPKTAFYDYDAKYERHDTQYLFDIDLPADTLSRVSWYAVKAFRVLGCRDLGRVDFMIDRQANPYLLEVNTMPGFTSHSLLPMAAARHGLTMPSLTDRLVDQAKTRRASAVIKPAVSE